MRRILAAPPDVVWKCWSQATHLAAWWGPRGFTTPHCELDFRVDGKWLLCMQGQEGRNKGWEAWLTGKYLEIVPFERIICTDCFADSSGKMISPNAYGMEGWPEVTDLIVHLAECREGTRMTVTQTAPLQLALNFGVDVGWSQSFDKLEAYLAQLV